MKSMRLIFGVLGLAAVIAAMGVGCGDDNTNPCPTAGTAATCGPGTAAQNGQCVPQNNTPTGATGGAGGCRPGTKLVNGACQ